MEIYSTGKVKTLLEYSYYQSKDLHYENIKNGDQVFKDIYYRIVSISREKVRKALRKDMTRLILRTIYLLKTTNVIKTVEQIIGDFENYQGSIWRLAMVHATASYVFSSNNNQRILDILDMCETYFPYSDNEAINEKKRVIQSVNKLKEEEDPDIFQYINTYCCFGNYLLP